MRIYKVMEREFIPLDESLITNEVCMRCAQCCKSTSSTQYAANNATDFVDTVIGDRENVHIEWHNPIMVEMSDLTDHQIAVKHPYEVVFICPKLKEKDGLKICSIYENRPSVCKDYNCFTRANEKKQRPYGWDKIKEVIKSIHDVDIEWTGPMKPWKLGQNVINVKEIK